MAMVFTLLPVAVFAQNDPVITIISITRDSETTATITFESTQAGSIGIVVKNSNGLFDVVMGDSGGVTVGTNIVKYEKLKDS